MFDFSNIHLFEINKRFFVRFAYSSRLFEIDENTYQILGSLQLKNEDIFSKSKDVIDEFSNLYEEEMAYRGLLSKPEMYQRDKTFQSIVIYVSQACNFSCVYCWNEGGTFGLKSKIMTMKTADIAINTIIEWLSASGVNEKEEITITFYGGEPLLNFSVIKKIVLDIHNSDIKRPYRFTTDTNGFLLKGDSATFLAKYFSTIGISIDGKESVQNVQRPLKSGKGSWETIKGNIGLFPNKEILTLRATLTNNSDSYLDTFLALTEFGIRRINLEYYQKPLYKQSDVLDQLYVNENRQKTEYLEFINWYIDFIRKYKNLKEVPFFHNIILTASELEKGLRNPGQCGTGESLIAIDCTGKVFPCYAFVGLNDFIMGDLKSHNKLKAISEVFPNRVENNKNYCHKCWARNDCNGGCLALNFQATGNLVGPYEGFCNKIKSELELGLYAMARIDEECPWHLAQLEVS